MLRKKVMTLCLTIVISLSLLMPVFAATETVMEYCGAYLFEWRPVDCGDGKVFTGISQTLGNGARPGKY